LANEKEKVDNIEGGILGYRRESGFFQYVGDISANDESLKNNSFPSNSGSKDENSNAEQKREQQKLDESGNQNDELSAIETKKLLIIRICLFMCIPFNVFVLIIAAIVNVNCSTYACDGFVVDISPSLEFSTTFFILIYFFRYREDLKNTFIFCQKSNIS
jgi:hypothetical protein